MGKLLDYVICKHQWRRQTTLYELQHFQQCGMCDQQRLRSAGTYMQSDQILCLSLKYYMSVKLLTEHHLELLSLQVPRMMCHCCLIVLAQKRCYPSGVKVTGVGNEGQSH